MSWTHSYFQTRKSILVSKIIGKLEVFVQLACTYVLCLRLAQLLIIMLYIQ